MKTSVIEVRDMLSVLSVSGVERRIGEVPGVESVTVNYAAGNATVRYDETRLDVGDIKSDVRQSEYESTASAVDSPVSGHEGDTTAGAPPTTAAPAAPKPSPTAAPPATPARSASAVNGQPDKAAHGAPPVTPKSAPDGAAAMPASAAPAGDGHRDKAAPEKS
jgi:copper chaperone CopZ